MFLLPEQLRFCEVEEREMGVAPRPGFQWIVLQRHGRRPLAISGRALFRANNEYSGVSFWSELSVFETDSRRLAASLRHVTPEAFGPPWCDAWLCDGPGDIRSIFVEHDPLAAFPSFQIGDFPACSDISRFRGAWAVLLTAVLGPAAVPRAIA